MKLLMITGDRSLAAGKQGAFSETLSELCKHFERIDIFCPRVDVSQQVRVIHDNVYIHTSRSSLLFQSLFILKKGKELFRIHHHDVMTVHEYPPFYNGIGARMLRRSILRQDSLLRLRASEGQAGQVGIPTVLEIHHIVGWPKASSCTEFVGLILSRLFLASHTKKFEVIRVVNGTVKKQLSMWGVAAERISIVPSVYLDLGLIHSVNNTHKKFDIVFAARLADNKGLSETIRALALLPQATMLVIGDGPIRNGAETLASSLGISSRITFAGWLPTARDVLASIASGRLFIMNSKSEGNPRVAIEAMSLGVPVLATRVGIMPDVIIDGVNGVFTDGTPQDIAAKAQVLLSDEQKLKLMGIEAAKIADRFEKKAAIKAYADFLKGLVHSLVQKTLRGSV